MKTEAIPRELGSLHCTERERVGSSRTKALQQIALLLNIPRDYSVLRL
jgi:hypothetical protein